LLLGPVVPCRYEGARTSDKFLEFLKKKLEEDKGFARVEELDTLVKDFVGADKKVGGGCSWGRVCGKVGAGTGWCVWGGGA
jgi:hypothetical protein